MYLVHVMLTHSGAIRGIFIPPSFDWEKVNNLQTRRECKFTQTLWIGLTPFNPLKNSTTLRVSLTHLLDKIRNCLPSLNFEKNKLI